MIRRQYDHQPFGIARKNFKRRKAKGRSGIAADRFGHNLLGENLGNLLLDGISNGLIRENIDALGRNQRLNPFQCLGEKGLFSEEAKQLLGLLAAAQRPEARAASSRQNHTVGMLEDAILMAH